MSVATSLSGMGLFVSFAGTAMTFTANPNADISIGMLPDGNDLKRMAEIKMDKAISVLNCDTQCNFFLVDDENFIRYKSGLQFRYYGGFYKSFPIRITAPHSDYLECYT